MEIKTKDFKEKVLQADKPVLVDFWGSWCIPCKQMEAMVKELAEKRTDVDIYKMNVSKNPVTAKEYNVMGVPTFVLFEKGKEKARVIAAQSLGSLETFISENLT